MKPKTVRRDGIRQDVSTQIPFSMSGLVAGTLILTGDGALPIEFLAPGDRIISRAKGMVRLQTVEAETLEVAAARLAPGALGALIPQHATMMAATQQVMLRGAQARDIAQSEQAIVPVSALINGDTITDLGLRRMRLIRLVFERPEVIYADGIEVAINQPAAHLVKAA